MSPTASLPEETALCLSVTHPACLDSWTHVTTPRLYFEDHCFVSPSASAEGVDPLPSDSLQYAQTHWLFRLYSLSTLVVFFKIVLLILREFPTMYFDHIYPLPPPLHSHFLWTFRFLLASHQNSDTDKHKFWSTFLIRTIQIASNSGKTPCFLQLPKADETHKEINGGLLLFKCHVDGVIICANKTHCHLILTCSSLNYASYFFFPLFW